MCDTLMIKVIKVMHVRNKPYATIERTDFSNALILDNLV